MRGHFKDEDADFQTNDYTNPDTSEQIIRIFDRPAGWLPGSCAHPWSLEFKRTIYREAYRYLEAYMYAL